MFDAVQADFKLNEIDAPMFFGWRETAKHKRTDQRLVWIPGDSGNAVGEVRPPRQRQGLGGSGQPRAIGTLAELVTVRIEAFDSQFAEDERFQYKAVRFLYDAWYAAVYRAAHGKFSIVSQEYDLPFIERKHGAAIIAVVEIEAPLPDVVNPVVPADAEGDITTTLDDVSEKTLSPSP